MTDKVSPPGSLVWVQDYQLQLVPAMLRERRPDLRIGFFLHIPFPPTELFMQQPQREEIIRGLLGADLVGFQTPLAAQNFLRLAHHLLGLRHRGNMVEVDGRVVRAGAFPVSIDVTEMEQLVDLPEVRQRAAQIRLELGEPKTLVLGVDRLDYTKGIQQRLSAYGELLEEGRVQVPDTVLVQVATPTRERVEHYYRLREGVEREVGRINGEFGRVGAPAVHYLFQSADRTELAALFLAADVMAVTPLRDGMNLVAKEYVAARTDLGGTLVLSEFAGAARELREAYLCNPHDINSIKDALIRAANADKAEATNRMKAMRRYLREHGGRHWAANFLNALTGK
jgi:trehalose 6-phosphate synthase